MTFKIYAMARFENPAPLACYHLHVRVPEWTQCRKARDRHRHTPAIMSINADLKPLSGLPKHLHAKRLAKMMRWSATGNRHHAHRDICSIQL